MTFKIEPIKLMGLSIHNVLVGVLESYGQVFRESGDICMTMGFDGIAEYTEAYGNYLNGGSEHRHLLYPHDVAESHTSQYLIKHKYFDYSENVSYGTYSHGPVDSLLSSSSLYDVYLEKLEPNGCLFLIRPTEQSIAQLYGKNSDTYNRLGWICEDWGEE